MYIKSLFEVFCFLFHHILDVDGIEGYGTSTQLWDIEALEAFVIEGWVSLRQYEGLVRFALAVDVAEVRLAIETVIALAGKDKPSA